tara:strand:- start:1199 stop:1930 length:732 start_codon:yes stop_codon:yes gene_type:complete
MADSSTKVFILEVMGRHAGWIAASAGLAKEEPSDPPHIILFPEKPFNQKSFLEEVNSCVNKIGYCVIVVSEGLKDSKGKFLSDSNQSDSFGHKQLGGVAPYLANLIKHKLGLKYHWALSDYLQRSARHISSQVDLDQAYEVGKSAVKLALKGENAVMPIIERISNNPYRWKIGKISLSKVANVEKKMPKNFITKNGFGITKSCKNYLKPLIQGEASSPFKNGVIEIARLQNKLVKKKLKQFKL